MISSLHLTLSKEGDKEMKKKKVFFRFYTLTRDRAWHFLSMRLTFAYLSSSFFSSFLPLSPSLSLFVRCLNTDACSRRISWQVKVSIEHRKSLRVAISFLFFCWCVRQRFSSLSPSRSSFTFAFVYLSDECFHRRAQKITLSKLNRDDSTKVSNVKRRRESNQICPCNSWMFRRLTTAVAFFDFKQQREEQRTSRWRFDFLRLPIRREFSASRSRFFPLRCLDQSELDVCVCVSME